MPRQVGRDRQGNLVAPDPATGQWRPLTGEEHGNIVPVNVLDEYGLGGNDALRFTIKNLGSNPALGLMVLKAKGYDAIKYGDGINFAIRKSAQEPWRLVDPGKGGVEEVWRDFTDLLGDIAVGTATGLGTAAGGGFASIATGAASGAAAELARQNIARTAAGLPLGADVPSVVGSAIGGGIAPPIGKAVGAVVRGAAGKVANLTKSGGLIGRAGENIATKIGSIRPLESVEISDILLETAARKGQPVLRPADVTQLYQRHMDEVAEKVIGGRTLVRNAKVKLSQPVNIEPIVDELGVLRDVINPSSKFRELSPAKSALQDQMVAILNPPSRQAIAARVEAAGAQEVLDAHGFPIKATSGDLDAVVDKQYQAAVQDWRKGLRKVPPLVAFRVKKVLQDEAARLRGFATAGAATPGAVIPGAKEEGAALTSFVRRYTESLHKQLNPEVARLDSRLSELIRARNAMRRMFGENPLNPTKAESTVRRAFEKGGGEIRKVIETYDAAFNTRFSRIAQQIAGPGRAVPKNALDAARQTAEGGRFTPIAGDPGEYGLPGAIPRFTAGGNILGPSLIGAAAGFAGGGGPLGGLAGAAAAPFLFSPAALVKMAPRATKLNAAINAMASGVQKVQATDFVRQSVKALGAYAAQSTGRRIASQDSRGRRRAVFAGQ